MSYTGHRNIAKPDGSTSDSWLSFTCAHCSSKVSGAVVATADHNRIKWLQCPSCGNGSVHMREGFIYQSAQFGPDVQGLPNDVAEAFGESRRCMSVNAFTAAELLCRKILMHVAVDKGATEGDTFAAYLLFLETHGYVTPPMKEWVNLIRKHGNASTHKLASPDKSRAESTVMFTAELLRLVYEMEFMAKRYATPTP